ncbi:MAG TPA: ATP synthase F0 subunit A [candidate division Zixibacteria bacterium]|nr:ATP synthase F0 subunit A [candidate division Zixibacteria bacterium]
MVAQAEHPVLADTVAHAASHTAEQGAPEFPNVLEILHQTSHGDSFLINLLFQFRIVAFSAIVWLILGLLAYFAFRKRALVPTPIQNFMEWVVESLSNMITGILGERGKKFVPFIGTLFVYIFAMNLFGLIPGMFSPTSKLNTTLALAICVFLYVQFTGLRSFGILGYMHHLAGSPKSTIEWCLVPLNLPLHIIGELARPVSLSLRLFGNITGEDMLLAIFATLGVSILSFTHLPVGIPLQLPFIFLAILTSFVQALVFTLLTTIYFSLMSTHDEEHH